jgi:hypothetical protein
VDLPRPAGVPPGCEDREVDCSAGSLVSVGGIVEPIAEIAGSGFEPVFDKLPVVCLSGSAPQTKASRPTGWIPARRRPEQDLEATITRQQPGATKDGPMRAGGAC